MLSIFIAPAILAFGISSATAAPLNTTVQGLYRQCKSPDNVFLCEAYIAGVGDILKVYGAGGAKVVAICGEPSYAEMVQAFVNWADVNPNEWGKDRLFGVVGALTNNWRCQ